MSDDANSRMIDLIRSIVDRKPKSNSLRKITVCKCEHMSDVDNSSIEILGCLLARVKTKRGEDRFFSSWRKSSQLAKVGRLEKRAMLSLGKLNHVIR